jgi:type VI secretion system protein VasL
MTINDHTLKTGGDPRALADFAALREEINKLTHPARPDISWSRVEQLSLSLFRQNGIELQTVAWYTLARTHLTGMAGLNEGLAILEALLTHQWRAMWPQPVHARMEIIAGLSVRLQSVLRTLSLSYSDLPLIYQAEQHLLALRNVLQRLELKNASQMSELCIFMHNAATRLENIEPHLVQEMPVVIPPFPAAQAGFANISPVTPLIYVAHQESESSSAVITSSQSSTFQWKGFTTGALLTLSLGGAAFWGWQSINQEESILPLTVSEAALTTLAGKSSLWLQDYGFALIANAKPENIDKFKMQWQQLITSNALPAERLTGWHQGMEGLEDLTRRLNELDERKGKYLTGSELKSMVFTITQNFARAEPVEEQLYQLSEMTSGTPELATSLSRTDMHLKQLLNRYMLIKQHAEKY